MKTTTREKRVLIGGGGIALLVLAYYLTPILMPEDLTVTVTKKQNELRLLREMVSQEESFKGRLDKDQQRLTQDQARLLPGDNAATAASTLQKIVQELSDASGVEIPRKTPMPEQKVPDTNLTKISLQLQDLNCTMEQFVRFLTALESHDKFLKVDELQISSRRLQNRDQLFIQMLRVAGYVATPTPAAKPGEKAAGVN